MRFAAILTVIGLVTGICHAQELRLTNSGNDTIIMKYLPSSDRPKKMKEKRIPPSENGSVTVVKLYGRDPYDVSFCLEPKTTQSGTAQVFHAKVGQPIALRQLSGQGVFDVSLAIAANNRRGRVIYQASVAALQNRDRRVEVYSEKSQASEFAKRLLERRWDTIYEAENGNTYRAAVNFDTLTFETDNFTGRFTDLAIFDDDRGCHVVGKWKALNSKGDVFFTVEHSRPTILNGEYIFDGRQKRYFWKSQR